MIKARKRFVLYAILCVFILLFVLLGIINGVNFAMAAEDADQVTEILSQEKGAFGGPMSPIMDGMDSPMQDPQSPMPPAPIIQENESPGNSALNTNIQNQITQGFVAQDVNPQGMNFPPNFGGFFPGLLGPLDQNFPEMENSLRYFTFSFDENKTAEQVAMQISAVTADEARDWAQSLLNGKTTGWTRTVYRYRVYESNGKTFVTVIDQSRELRPCYRILIISLIGLVVGVLVSYIALMFIGRMLFKPLEEADRKQKRFIANAEKEFKAPLTIINASTEIMERESGETEQTQTIDRQIKKMIGLVKNLSNISVFDDRNLTMLRCDIAELAQAMCDAMKSQFEEMGRDLRTAAEPPVTIIGDSESINDLFSELLDNALKFSCSWAELKVCQEEGHSVIIASNDTNLPDGTVDQVFDRFTRLDNAKDLPGAGLGLSHVKEIVQAHNGRASAKVEYGVFTLRINL